MSGLRVGPIGAMTFTQAGTGASERLAQEKMRDVVSVMDFGATGDGTTDDTDAIQAFATYVCATGKKGHFPSGTYKITDSIRLTKRGWELCGSGRNSTIIRQATDNTPIFRLNDEYMDSFKIHGFYFDFSSQQVVASTRGVAIEFDGTDLSSVQRNFYNFEIRNCSFNNCRRGIVSYASSIVWGYLIEQCWFVGTMTGAAIWFGTSVGQPNVAIRSIYIGRQANVTEHDILLTSAETILLESIEVNNGTYASGQYSIYGISSIAATVLSCKVENCVWESSALFNFPGGEAITVQGSNFIDLSGTRSSGASFIRADTGGQVSVKGCNFYCTGTNTLPVAASEISEYTGCSISGDVVEDWGTYGLAYPRISTTGAMRVGSDTLQIGTASSDFLAEISSEATSGRDAFSVLTYYGTAYVPRNLIRKARGTTSAPSAVQSSDVLGIFGVRAYGATAFSASERGGLRFVASQTWTDSAQGCAASIWTTPIGGTTSVERLTVQDDGVVRPAADNTQNLGAASFRWGTVYAGTGTINTSDAREKQQVRELSVAERAVAVRCKGLLRAFKFNSSVSEKGDGARWHFGVMAQEVQEAFAAEGLDAANYSLFCYDEWAEQPEIKDGESVVQEYHAAGNRYGIRYDELLAFVLAAL